MPSLIQNKQDKELIVKTRKVWSDINNAFLLSQQDYGVVADNSLLFNATDNSVTITTNLAKYFNGAKICKNSTQEGCSQYYYETKYSSKILDKDGNAATSAESPVLPKIILTNGAIITVSSNLSGCAPKEYTATKTDEFGQTIYNDDGTPQTYKHTSTICANIHFDVNGVKAPNQFGRDTYWFWVYPDKLQPCYNRELGGASFKNILSGTDKLEYLDYKKGQTLD